MQKLGIISVLLLTVFSFSSFNVFSNSSAIEDSVIMGSTYANDVYYSLENDEVKNVDRVNWDIAFSTSMFSASILTNGGNGIELYWHADADTSDWATLDTAGLGTWEPFYNSLETWEEGAFNQETSGLEWSYGWGTYNTVSHNIEGDYLYIIKLPDMSYKKIWIVEKQSMARIYTFRYADLDGSNDTTFVLNVNSYTTKSFVGYSISGNQIVDRDPLADSWDILFTKYMGKIPMGPDTMDYPVAGVLTNSGVYAVKVEGEEETTYNDYAAHPLDSVDNISSIGSDWKKMAGMPPVYTVVDSLLYFISDIDGNLYKFYFTDFVSGSSGNGKIAFNKELIVPSSISEFDIIRNVVVYPNPASEVINIIYNLKEAGNVNLSIYDITGKQVHSTNIKGITGLNKYTLDNLNLVKGNYLLKLNSKNDSKTLFIIITT